MHSNKGYRGRFAPSPTGSLHFGSLLTAVASYTQARQQNGCWLIRIEDLDRTREIKGSASEILRDLAAFGMQSDEPVLYQSNRDDAYQQALLHLQNQGLVFACRCSRKQLKGQQVYPGTCERAKLDDEPQIALRIRAPQINTPLNQVTFIDQVQGRLEQNIATQCGAFVIRRADQLFAYQLAVVVDDATQGVTEVVRGCDLLDSTPRQIYLQQLLNFELPDYLHLPLAVDAHGVKLSKQLASVAVDANRPLDSLIRAWHFLNQTHLPGWIKSVNDFWRWAPGQWQIQSIPKVQQICI